MVTTVPDDDVETEAAIRAAGAAFVLEERMTGPELSLLALCDGENVVPLAPAQDYKRIFDGDLGPNTGGMGSYSPVPGFGPAEVEEIVDTVHRPVVATMAARGTPFRGVLYAGLMIGPEGPKVLEFNTRFGDPETQAVLPRLRCDLVDLCLAAREPGGLAGAEAELGAGREALQHVETELDARRRELADAEAGLDSREQALREAEATLTPREEQVLRMRFGIGEKSDHTLEEVGQKFTVTRERIRQIEAKALRKLRHPSRSKRLKSFMES